MLFNPTKPPAFNDDGCQLIATFDSWEEVGKFIYDNHPDCSIFDHMSLDLEKLGLELVSNYYTWNDDGNIIALYEKEKEEYIQYQK